MDLRHSKATLISLGAVDISGVPAVNQIARFFDADTIQGSANFTFTGSVLALTGNQTISSFLSIGATPALSGSIRLPNSGSVVFRDAADEKDFRILSFDDSDTLVIGEPTGGINLLEVLASDIVLRGPTTVRVTSDTAFRVRDFGGTTIFNVDTDNGGIVTVTGVLAVPTDYVELGPIPSTGVGTIRLSATSTIFVRNEEDNANLEVMSFGESTTLDIGAGIVLINLQTQTFVNGELHVHKTAEDAFQVRTDNGAALIFEVDTSNGGQVTIPSARLLLGTTPALSGTIRLQNTDSIVFRDSEDTEDLVIISFDASDQLDIGDNSNPGNIESLRLNSEQVIIPAGTLLIQGDGSGALRVRTATQGVMFKVNADDREVELTGTVNRAKTTDKMVSALVLTPNGTTATAVGLIPAGAIVLGVTTRVVSTIGGPSGYDVGDGVNIDRWGNSIAVALGTTSDPTDYQSSAIEIFPVATDVVISSDSGDFEEGSVRVTVHYKTLTAPTS